jgi:hypothetical protein
MTTHEPAGCTSQHDCEHHDGAHRHGPDRGHEAVPHDDHVDYLVGAHLHFPHDDHCDDHGPAATAAPTIRGG